MIVLSREEKEWVLEHINEPVLNSVKAFNKRFRYENWLTESQQPLTIPEYCNARWQIRCELYK